MLMQTPAVGSKYFCDTDASQSTQTAWFVLQSTQFASAHETITFMLEVTSAPKRLGALLNAMQVFVDDSRWLFVTAVLHSVHWLNPYLHLRQFASAHVCVLIVKLFALYPSGIASNPMHAGVELWK